MSDQAEVQEQLLLAALQVIESMSGSTYRRLRKPSTTSTVQISRKALIRLADAIDAVRPGLIDRMYEIADGREARG